MSSNEVDNIDKLYKNYDILNDAKEKIAEVSVTNVWSRTVRTHTPKRSRRVLLIFS